MFTEKKVATFRERFTELFDESEKTSTELGKEIHVSNQTISAWKNGTRSPKDLTIKAIADYFHVNYLWLWGFDVEKEADTATMIREIWEREAMDDERKKAADLYMSLSDKNRQAAMTYMKFLKSQERSE